MDLSQAKFGSYWKTRSVNSNGYKAVGHVIDSPYDMDFDAYFKMQCIPIGSLLLAMNVHHVHFFSLDIEGMFD